MAAYPGVVCMMLKPRELDFPISFMGDIVLNAEMESTKSILKYIHSVNLFVLNANR